MSYIALDVIALKRANISNLYDWKADDIFIFVLLCSTFQTNTDFNCRHLHTFLKWNIFIGIAMEGIEEREESKKNWFRVIFSLNK